MSWLTMMYCYHWHGWNLKVGLWHGPHMISMVIFLLHMDWWLHPPANKSRRLKSYLHLTLIIPLYPFSSTTHTTIKNHYQWKKNPHNEIKKTSTVPLGSHPRVTLSPIWNPTCQPLNGQNSSSRHHHTPTPFFHTPAATSLHRENPSHPKRPN